MPQLLLVPAAMNQDSDGEAVFSTVDSEAIDVKCLLLGPQDFVPVSSVIGAGQNPKNSMETYDGSVGPDGPAPTIAQEGEDAPKKEAHGTSASEVDAGSSQMPNDLSSACEDYLLDVEFGEDCGDLGSDSTAELQLSVPKCQDSVFCCSKADTLGISHPSEAIIQRDVCQNNVFDHTNQALFSLSRCDYESEMAVEAKWSKSSPTFTLHNFQKLKDVSGLLMTHSYSDKDDTDPLFSPGIPYDETFNASMIKHYSESTPVQISEIERLSKEDVSSKSPTQENSNVDVLPAQKRLRKPNRRYIDESADLNSISFRKRKLSSSSSKGKFLGDKCEKDNHAVTGMERLYSEESSIKPIQVPFGSPEEKDCSKRRASGAIGVLDSDDDSSMEERGSDSIRKVRSKENGDQRENNRTTKVRFRETGGRRETDCTSKVRYREIGGQREGDCITKVRPGGWRESDCSAKLTSRETGGRRESDYMSRLRTREAGEQESACVKKVRSKEDGVQEESDSMMKARSEEDGGRRKHHRLWTIAEVKKLIEGVSQYGVGRWTDIKRLFFSSSRHRTSVDLKDKWRNLLKASRLQKQSRTGGDSKRNLAWRPLPKSILDRVSELSAMYPYPRARKSKLSHVQHASSPISIDRDTRCIAN